MKKTHDFIPLIIIGILLALFLPLIIWLTIEHEKEQTRMQERAYYEGQKDALTGDVRIAKVNDSTYRWIKSPWNDGSTPLFNPNK